MKNLSGLTTKFLRGGKTSSPFCLSDCSFGRRNTRHLFSLFSLKSKKFSSYWNMKQQKSEQVRRAFNETFPERNSPDKKTVYRTVRKFNEHGSISNQYKGKSGRKIIQRTVNNIAIVQRAITENPTTSVRRNETNLSKSTFHKILKKDIRLHPYKIQIKHELQPCDDARRREFCNWFISKDQRFTEMLVVTDEAAFTMNERVNTQNTRFWSNNPPEGNVFEKSIRREKLSAWAGFYGNGNFIGPFFYDENLTEEIYLKMLNELIIRSLKLANPGNQFQRLWFQQHGAPAHQRIIVKARLQKVFGQRIISLENAVEWPPRNPDITPCDFFLWGYVKERVFKTTPPSLIILRQRNEGVFQELKENGEMIRKTLRSMVDRSNTFPERNGGHAEGY
ncbi:Protein of unknown function DUF4817 [Trinorchestia longiramus]|nr:Protein of unknown function DUF4817 [Trinorchestia longiramus]